MKGTSNLLMWLTLVLVVSLALVLGLVLLLLAELYCSPLVRRRRLRHLGTPNATTADTICYNPSGHSQPQSDASPSSPDSFTAPTSSLHPVDPGDDIEKQLPPPSENKESGGGQHQANSNQVVSKLQIQKGCSGDPVNGSPLVYISNPIYDDEGRPSRVDGNNTPFETPDTSPSCLETEDSSGDDEREEISSFPIWASWKVVSTPPLTPMKKLPVEACSVSLKDARSLDTSGSDTNSNNGVSSSSLTPCTSPSL